MKSVKNEDRDPLVNDFLLLDIEDQYHVIRDEEFMAQVNFEQLLGFLKSNFPDTQDTVVQLLLDRHSGKPIYGTLLEFLDEHKDFMAHLSFEQLLNFLHKDYFPDTRDHSMRLLLDRHSGKPNYVTIFELMDEMDSETRYHSVHNSTLNVILKHHSEKVEYEMLLLLAGYIDPLGGEDIRTTARELLEEIPLETVDSVLLYNVIYDVNPDRPCEHLYNSGTREAAIKLLKRMQSGKATTADEFLEKYKW